MQQLAVRLSIAQGHEHANARPARVRRRPLVSIDTIQERRHNSVHPDERPDNSVKLTRTYQDDAGNHDTGSFSGSELLRIAHLAGKAYDRVGAQRAEDKAAAS